MNNNRDTKKPHVHTKMYNRPFFVSVSCFFRRLVSYWKTYMYSWLLEKDQKNRVRLLDSFVEFIRFVCYRRSMWRRENPWETESKIEREKPSCTRWMTMSHKEIAIEWRKTNVRRASERTSSSSPSFPLPPPPPPSTP